MPASARFRQSVTLLHEYFPGCAVTTDLIVAFPGETDAEFAETLDFIRHCGFAAMHIFPYSRRPGTRADAMPGQLPNAVKEARSREAIAVAAEMSRSFRAGLAGSVQQVLFEEADGEFYTGHAPNYCRVYVRGQDLHNRVLPVRIGQIFRDGVFGQLLGGEI